MPNHLISREAVKRAARQAGATAIPDDRNRLIDMLVLGTSAEIESRFRRRFIPITQTRSFRWPPYDRAPGWILYVDGDLLSVTSFTVKAQDVAPVTIPAADYFLEPQQFGPPYKRIEVDLSSSSALQAGDTPQRSASVAGDWGYPAYPGTSNPSTEAAGTVTSGLAADAAATSFVCSDASLIDVGNTLLIGSERIFVSERGTAASGTTLNGGIDAQISTVAVTVNDGTKINVGEVILVDSERMFVRDITGNVLTVSRAWDATVLAAHLNAAAVYVYRTLTIVRGVNGTTAAVHANASAISRYVIYPEIADLALADVISKMAQTDAAWGREIGEGEGAKEFTGRNINAKWKNALRHLRRIRTASI